MPLLELFCLVDDFCQAFMPRVAAVTTYFWH